MSDTINKDEKLQEFIKNKIVELIGEKANESSELDNIVMSNNIDSANDEVILMNAAKGTLGEDIRNQIIEMSSISRKSTVGVYISKDKLEELRDKGTSTLISQNKFNNMSSEARNKMIEIMKEFADEEDQG